MKFLVLLPFLLYIVGTFGRETNYFAIKNQDTGLVLDGDSELINAKQFAGTDSQYWKLSDAGSGKYYIVNKKTGKVLEAGASTGTKVRVVGKKDSTSQKWTVNTEGSTFVNADGQRAIGAGGVVGAKNTGKQKFKLDYPNA